MVYSYRAYSYYIEVSLDQESWEKVIDYRRYLCRSWQYLYFPSRAVQYIKIVGTNNTVNKVFCNYLLFIYIESQINEKLFINTNISENF